MRGKERKCYGKYHNTGFITLDRDCALCDARQECKTASPFEQVQSAVKLDQGKRQYSLIIPQMMEIMLPRLSQDNDNYGVVKAVLELSKASHKNNLSDIIMHCHNAVEHLKGLTFNMDGSILDELAKAMEYGIAKYDRNNWKKGMEWSRLIDAGMRHGIAILRGEDIDKDSGNTHLAHMLGSIHMLVGNIELGVGTDDITIK